MRRGAGCVAQVITALVNTGAAEVGQAVHILLCIKTVADLSLEGTQVAGEGLEHQNTVNGVICIDLIDGLQQHFTGSILGQLKNLDIYANGFALLESALFVAQVIGSCANTDDTQSGVYALCAKGSGTLQQVCYQSLIYFFAKQLLCHIYFLLNY